MNLYRVGLHKGKIASACYVEAETVEDAVAEAEWMNPKWKVAKTDENTPEVELLGTLS